MQLFQVVHCIDTGLQAVAYLRCPQAIHSNRVVIIFSITALTIRMSSLQNYDLHDYAETQIRSEVHMHAKRLSVFFLLPCGAASLANCASSYDVPALATLLLRSHVDTKEGVCVKAAVHAAEGAVLAHTAGARGACWWRRAFILHVRLVHLRLVHDDD